MPCKFFLGTHEKHWLQRTDAPLFISARRLRRSRTARALGEWALDSGGFTELSMHGRWMTTPQQYADEAQRWQEAIGGMQWAAPQDWMCEPGIIAKTGWNVREHQLRTIASYQALRALAPSVPWIPVLQGWHFEQYLRHVETYAAAGVDLASVPVVGLGSVCRRQHTDLVVDLTRELHGRGIRLHGFGLKVLGLRRCHQWLESADSMAWSLDARRSRPLPGCPHKACNNCLVWALRWRAKVIESMSSSQPTMF